MLVFLKRAFSSFSSTCAASAMRLLVAVLSIQMQQLPPFEQRVCDWKVFCVPCSTRLTGRRMNRTCGCAKHAACSKRVLFSGSLCNTSLATRYAAWLSPCETFMSCQLFLAVNRRVSLLAGGPAGAFGVLQALTGSPRITHSSMYDHNTIASTGTT